MNLNTTDTNLLLAYKGPFLIDILSNLGNYIKQMFGNESQIGTKLYKVFFELTQNVAKYSAEKKPINNSLYYGIGSLSLEENNDALILKTSNLIRSSDGPILQRYCDEINQMNKNQLRDYRSEKRKQIIDIRDTGAHIGIIQIGLLSLNKLELDINAIDETFSVYTISATINKDE
jgi:hypothetical protein